MLGLDWYSKLVKQPFGALLEVKQITNFFEPCQDGDLLKKLAWSLKNLAYAFEIYACFVDRMCCLHVLSKISTPNVEICVAEIALRLKEQIDFWTKALELAYK